MLVAFLIAVAAAVIALLVACETGAVPRQDAGRAPGVAPASLPAAGEPAARR